MVKRYDKPVTVLVGQREVVLEPIRGLKRLAAFEDAVTEEISAFKDRLESGGILPSSPEHLLTKAADIPRLLRLACPAFEDEDLMDSSSPRERLGILEDCLSLNGIGHLAVFLAPATLLEIGLRLRAKSDEIFQSEFGSLESNVISSEQD